MAKIAASELSGAALNWAVALCANPGAHLTHDRIFVDLGMDTADFVIPDYANRWDLIGPMIDRHRISVISDFDEIKDGWIAESYDAKVMEFGPTAAVALLRCYVASTLGDHIDIPSQLV